MVLIQKSMQKFLLLKHQRSLDKALQGLLKPTEV